MNNFLKLNEDFFDDNTNINDEFDDIDDITNVDDENEEKSFDKIIEILAYRSTFKFDDVNFISYIFSNYPDCISKFEIVTSDNEKIDRIYFQDETVLSEINIVFNFSRKINFFSFRNLCKAIVNYLGSKHETLDVCSSFGNVDYSLKDRILLSNKSDNLTIPESFGTSSYKDFREYIIFNIFNTFGFADDYARVFSMKKVIMEIHKSVYMYNEKGRIINPLEIIECKENCNSLAFVPLCHISSSNKNDSLTDILNICLQKKLPLKMPNNSCEKTYDINRETNVSLDNCLKSKSYKLTRYEAQGESYIWQWFDGIAYMYDKIWKMIIPCLVVYTYKQSNAFNESDYDFKFTIDLDKENQKLIRNVYNLFDEYSECFKKSYIGRNQRQSDLWIECYYSLNESLDIKRFHKFISDFLDLYISYHFRLDFDYINEKKRTLLIVREFDRNNKEYVIFGIMYYHNLFDEYVSEIGLKPLIAELFTKFNRKLNASDRKILFKEIRKGNDEITNDGIISMLIYVGDDVIVPRPMIDFEKDNFLTKPYLTDNVVIKNQKIDFDEQKLKAARKSGSYSIVADKSRKAEYRWKFYKDIVILKAKEKNDVPCFVIETYGKY